MAKVSKPVDKGIPSIHRTQVFTDADASTGDILDIEATLGRAAKKIVIETGGGSNLTVRPNVVRVIYPLREESVFDGPLHGAPVNVADGREITDGSIAQHDATPSLELAGPVKDLEVTWSAGTWSIVVY